MLKALLAILTALVYLATEQSFALNNCRRLAPVVKQNTVNMIAYDFPWYYILGLIQTETNCQWRTSLDGWGSVGFMQLTPSLIPAQVKQKFNIQDPVGNIQAGIYYLYNILHKNNPSATDDRHKKLWLTFQMYNGGNWPVMECRRANSFVHSQCYEACLNCDRTKFKCRGKVCVWKTSSGCKQYRHACDINYQYSIKVYNNGQKYRDVIVDTWTYW